MNPLKTIDRLLNQITMYRLLVYGLSLLLACAAALSAAGRLPLSASGIVATVSVLLATCYVANWALATLWDAATNSESWLITALILGCILPPSTTVHQLAFVALGGLLAMASKYLLARHRKHLFNPAAFAAIVLGLTGWLPAVWWVGTPALLPVTVVLGLLVVRKIRRFQLLLSFVVASLAMAVVVGAMHQQVADQVVLTAFRSSPLVFLGTIMLTEPETTPSRLWQQRCYGLLVGLLFTSQLRLGSVSATPELALIVANIYSYAVNPKLKLRLRLQTKHQLAPNIYDFGFVAECAVAEPGVTMPGVPEPGVTGVAAAAPLLQFQPGQYLTWTLPGIRSDSRGNRRTFSIASAPDEAELHLAVKISQPGSSFKRALVALKPGAPIMAGQLAGDFVLPRDAGQKLAFIAGGIGITPFVSMAKAMIRAKQRRDIVLFYLVTHPDELCYRDLWKAAQAFGLRLVPVLTHAPAATDQTSMAQAIAGQSPTGRITTAQPATGPTATEPTWPGLTGRLTPDTIRREVPDYLERRYYLSGPPGLVDAYSHLLRQLAIKRQQIVTDHFSGY